MTEQFTKMSPNKFITHGKTKLINGSILSPGNG